MTDDNTPDHTPDSFDADGAAMSEDDLDQLLEQASSLADGISEDVGAKDDTTSVAGTAQVNSVDLNPAANEADASQPAGDSTSETQSASSDLDEQLAGLEKLVDEVGTEVGSTPDPPDPPDPPKAGSGLTALMSELAESDPQVKEETPNPANLPSAAQTGVVGTGTLGVVSTPGTPQPTGIVGTMPKASTSTAAPAAAPAPTEVQAKGKGNDAGVSPLAVKITPLVLKVLDCLASILESLDKPFQKLGPSVRQAIGWMAIATFGTALLVFLVSLF